ncbi:MAG TPA: 3-deoxy-manno-octulosonate cytidylyltransferase [Planctomycetota bacterium]|nr:3-deoxy-manno-octulosonate cytidylyltransferase [Planctomycetota bacterium]
MTDRRATGESTTGRAALVLPARLASTRLPRKLLLAETGRPLLAHSVECALAAAQASGGAISRVLVAADCEELAAAARAAGAEAVLTDPNHKSGTDRIAEAAAALPEDVIVNLQADEPEMPAEAVLRVARLLLDAPGEVMATLAAPIASAGELTNPNVVKVVVDSAGHALYFSRAPIPWAREGWKDGRDPTRSVLRHFGMYAYRREFLLSYSKLPPSRLEELEKLEQLRALEAGHRIACAVVATVPEGIDTPEGYAAFVARRKRGTRASRS